MCRSECVVATRKLLFSDPLNWPETALEDWTVNSHYRNYLRRDPTSQKTTSGQYRSLCE